MNHVLFLLAADCRVQKIIPPLSFNDGYPFPPLSLVALLPLVLSYAASQYVDLELCCAEKSKEEEKRVIFAEGGWELGSLVGPATTPSEPCPSRTCCYFFRSECYEGEYVQHSQNPTICHNGSDASQDENP